MSMALRTVPPAPQRIRTARRRAAAVLAWLAVVAGAPVGAAPAATTTATATPTTAAAPRPPADAAAAPDAAPPLPAVDDDGETALWVMQPGQTLLWLQQRLLRPPYRWQDLRAHNRIADPRRIPVGTTVRIPLAWLHTTPLVGQVQYLHGEVRLHRGGDAQAPAVGTPLRVGDALTTGPQSSVSVRLGDGSQLMLRPHSRVVIERSDSIEGRPRVSTSRLRLEAGSLDAQVPTPTPAVRSRVDVRTPVVNLGVRGTRWRSHAEPAMTRLEVLEGRVDAGPQPVTGGQGTRATEAGVEPPRPLLPAPVLVLPPSPWPRAQAAWAAVDGAVRYRVQLLGADGTLLRDDLSDTPAAQWPGAALPDGPYALRVRAIDALGLEGRDAEHAFTLRDDPVPVPLAPRQEARIEAEAVEFDWRAGDAALPASASAPAAAPRWRLQVARDAGFTDLAFDRDDIAAAPARVPLPPGRHHWRVARLHADGGAARAGPWSPPVAFDLTHPPAPPLPPPTLQPPQRVDGRIALQWERLPGTRVRVQVARTVAFDAPLLVDQAVDGDAWSWQPPGPGRYWMRAARLDADGRASAFTPPVTVEIESARHRWWLLAPVLLMLLL